MATSPRDKLISSKDILEKTGISRATLNNYIKLGILPKPIVKKAGPDQVGTKQIGYFPEHVLDNIASVKRLKREGFSMTDIGQRFKQKPSTSSIDNDKKRITQKVASQSVSSITHHKEMPSMEEIADKFRDISVEGRPYSKSRIGQTRYKNDVSGRRIDDQDLKLSIGEIDTPAYLINHNFEIEWINKEAEDQIFNKPIKSIVDVESRNIFKLFFSWEFHVQLRNWEEVVAAHLSVVKSNLPKGNLVNLYSGISDKEINFLKKIYDTESSFSDENVLNTPIGFLLQDGERRTFQIHTMSFREGIFFVYVPTETGNHDLMKILSNRGRIIGELLNQRMPSLVSLCVLVADIQDSVKICAELLPEEYFDLVNGLWKKVGGCFEKYNGIYGKHAGDGMLYYFIKRPGTNYIMDAINCALEMRDKMKEFSCDWRLKKGWANDIYLNTAINEGQEFFGAIHSASNVEFTALGDSINYTGRLSDFARYGSIWTTKNVMSNLGQEERKKIRFGVHRREHEHEIFLENSFSRIIDLMEESGRNFNQFMDIATLPITEIIEKVQQE